MTLLRSAALTLLTCTALMTFSHAVRAEEDSTTPIEELKPAQQASPSTETSPPPASRKPKKEHRYFGTEKDPRIDAGIFHVGFAGGANFFIEPQVNPTTKAPLGEYFNDFGFGGGVFFDYDYSQMTENIPLMLRGFVGYKYILQSVHVFDVEGIVRRMWQFSESSSFGIGAGVSSALWYRTITDSSPYEETLFIPSFIVETGFEFNPVMVELKWLVNRLGSDSTINGLEFMLGIRF